ncbi:MAG: nucleotidyltransferase [Bacteroidia bacterium]
MQPTLLVLAAGVGSRYGGLKQLDQMGPGGETIIDYSVFDARQAGFCKVVFVIRHSIEEHFRSFFDGRFPSDIEVAYVYQELDNLPGSFAVPADRAKPWGTAHAVLVAEEAIQTPFAMINADDYYGPEAYQVMADFLRTVDPASDHYSLVGYAVKNTLSDFGTVSRGVCEVDAAGFLTSVTERTKIARKDGVIYFEDDGKDHALDDDTIVSMNMFGFTPTVFDYLSQYFADFLRDQGGNPKSEFYIPAAMSRAITEGQADLRVLSSDARWFGITYQEDRPIAVEKFAELARTGAYPLPIWS